MTTLDTSALRVDAGTRPPLGDRDFTHAKLHFEDKDAGKAHMADLRARIATLQDALYAEGQRALLVILQGMDTAGKSGTIRRVFQQVHPQGITVTAFKAPSDRELAHDYLWRVHLAAPPRGTIGVFDRSHYEDVGIVRVNGWIDDATAARRFDEINEFERMLVGNGTTIVKCWLDISPEEQRKELQERIDETDKHWKFNMGDLESRGQWHDYMEVYADALAATSTDHAPWYRVPADRRWVSGATVAQLTVDALEQMAPQVPAANPDFEGIEIPAV